MPMEQRSVVSEQIPLMALRAELSQRCEQAGSQSAWARRAGVCVSQVCDTLAGRREPSEAIVNALGCMMETTYRRIAKGTW